MTQTKRTWKLVAVLVAALALAGALLTGCSGNNNSSSANYRTLDQIKDSGKITIGNNVFIAPNVCIITEEHSMVVEERIRGLEYTHPVTIGNNVWICTGALVLPGVTIGDNSVIGAGSVVTKDIPPNSLAVGNPCRVIRSL